METTRIELATSCLQGRHATAALRPHGNRSRRDLNPRNACALAGLANQCIRPLCYCSMREWAHRDSNPEPSGYEPLALTVAPCAHTSPAEADEGTTSTLVDELGFAECRHISNAAFFTFGAAYSYLRFGLGWLGRWPVPRVSSAFSILLRMSNRRL